MRQRPVTGTHNQRGMPPTMHCHEPQSELVPIAKAQPPKVDATVAVYPTGCLGRKTPTAKTPKTNNARFTQNNKRARVSPRPVQWSSISCSLQKVCEGGTKYSSTKHQWTTKQENRTGKITTRPRSTYCTLARNNPTKKKKTEITIPGYTKEPCTCKKTHCTNCQGIMTLIRNDITGKTENLTNNDID